MPAPRCPSCTSIRSLEKDAQNQPTGKVTDPAADIAAFLMGNADRLEAE